MESEPAVCYSRFVTGQLMWKISGFSLCNLKPGKYFKSPKFGVSGGEKKWFLKLYPSGEHRGDSKGFVSVILLSNTDDAAHIIYEISITNTNSRTLLNIKYSERKSFISGAGWAKLISRETFLNNVPDDELLVFCKITSSELANRSSKKNASTDRIMNSLARDMGRILAEPEFADILLQVNEAKIRAHKIVLRSRSSVLAAMIDENTTEDNFRITDVEEDAFRELLRFIYTDKCSLKNVDFAIDVLAAAHRYALSTLKADCCEYLYDHMSAENVSDISISAFSAQETKLYEDCLDYICQEWPSVNFLIRPMKLLHSHPGILQDLIERFVA